MRILIELASSLRLRDCYNDNGDRPTK